MLPDLVSNQGPLTYESGALPIALRGPASVVYEQHKFRHNLTSDLIVTLTLGVGTYLLCATHLLIIFYLSVKLR